MELNAMIESLVHDCTDQATETIPKRGTMHGDSIAGIFPGIYLRRMLWPSH